MIKLLIASLIPLLLVGGCAGEAAQDDDCGALVASWINTLTHGGILDSIDGLIMDLYNDTTNEREYTADIYDCTNYAINLTHNLSDRYESGIVVRLPKGGEGIGHMMSWVRLNTTMYVIEPQSDLIYDSGVFNASIDDDRFIVTYGSKELGLTEANTTSRILHKFCKVI